jgi:hypothetical protein
MNTHTHHSFHISPTSKPIGRVIVSGNNLLVAIDILNDCGHCGEHSSTASITFSIPIYGSVMSDMRSTLEVLLHKYEQASDQLLEDDKTKSESIFN